MGLHKGMTNNPAGRPMGVGNRVTKELRTVLKDLIYTELENLPAKLEKLEDKDRIEVLIKLMPFVMPKVNNVQIDIGEPIDISWQ